MPVPMPIFLVVQLPYRLTSPLDLPCRCVQATALRPCLNFCPDCPATLAGTAGCHGTDWRQLGRVFERHAAQSALQANEQRSRQIINSAGHAFIAMDAGGVITDWNNAAETIFGWSQAEAVGQTVSDTIVPAHYREAHQRGLARFLSHGQAQVLGQRLELPALHRDGREFPIEITLWSLEEDYGWSFSPSPTTSLHARRLNKS